MRDYYFVKSEEIYKRGGRAMIIMDIAIDNFYAFKNFHMNIAKCGKGWRSEHWE